MSEEEKESTGEYPMGMGYTANEVILQELIYPSGYIDKDPDLSKLKEFVDRIIARSILRNEKDIKWIQIQFDIVNLLELMGAKAAAKVEKMRLLTYVITKSALNGELVKLGVAPFTLGQTKKKRRWIF